MPLRVANDTKGMRRSRKSEVKLVFFFLFLFSSFFPPIAPHRAGRKEGGGGEGQRKKEKEQERDHKTTDKGGYGFRILSSWSDILTDSFLSSFSTPFHSIAAATALVAIANNVSNLFPFSRNFFSDYYGPKK